VAIEELRIAIHTAKKKKKNTDRFNRFISPWRSRSAYVLT
jgi:hypothetical protein